jgi:exosortase A-associated hydrolase 2
VTEVPFFFPGGDRELFGVLHVPASSPPAAAFLFCAPFGEEKLWAHLVYVSFARELARRGFAVLRFDYRGTGDSEGDSEEATPEACLDDIRCALEVLREKCAASAPLGLLGLRFGATLAALAAERESGLQWLVLWSPVLRGAAYAQELLRTNIAAQVTLYREVREDRDAMVQAMKSGRTVNVEGYELSLAGFEQTSAIDLLVAPVRATARSLVVDIAPRPRPAVGADFARFAALRPEGTAVVSVEEPFWKEIKPLYARAERLFADTLRWMEPASNAV